MAGKDGMTSSPPDVITECVSIDTELLEGRRYELRHIQEKTGVQITCAVMVTGTMSAVQQALPLVEQALLAADSAHGSGAEPGSWQVKPTDAGIGDVPAATMILRRPPGLATPCWQAPVSCEQLEASLELPQFEPTSGEANQWLTPPVSSPPPFPSCMFRTDGEWEQLAPAPQIKCTDEGNQSPAPSTTTAAPNTSDAPPASGEGPTCSTMSFGPSLFLSSVLADTALASNAQKPASNDSSAATAGADHGSAGAAAKKGAQQDSKVARSTTSAASVRDAEAPREQHQHSEEPKTMKLAFPKPAALEGVKSRKRVILKMEGVGVTYTERSQARATISDVNLMVSQASRLLVTGAKGAGKSTCVKVMVGESIPTKGAVCKASGLRIGYVAQGMLEEHKHETPIQYMMRCCADTMHRESTSCPESTAGCGQQLAKQSRQPKIETYLADFGVDLESASCKRISELDGCARARLALAAAMWQNPQVLILDEPAKHLSREGVNALLLAINDYQGGVVLTAHNKDKDMFKSVVTETWAVRGGRLHHEDGPPPVEKNSGGGGDSARSLAEEIKYVEKCVKDGTKTEEEVNEMIERLRKKLTSAE
eukprot:gnl/TRDRNA2_/TRDRNA2_138361_c0_seq1.p1 gnl/TRDRNA2_/TRDRNA2_138361_c0~~gnl/TRDRNA2_/TRDRNA2_138361_c0_seq1.p1  ORF type:complete len:596 (+),score=117.87 gnl/TRDRNA2_/TRDRNA2_138361_c0_seq1:97-1884(+)